MRIARLLRAAGVLRTQTEDKMEIICNGVRLFVHTMGEKTAPALLLVHGNGEDHTIFEAAAQELAQRYYVILPDSRGHGASQPVTRYSYREMAKDMAALLEALNVNDVTVFGFSDGGIIALLMAMHHPQRLRRIIAAGANAHPLGVAFSCLRDVVKEWVKTRDGKLFLMMTQPMVTRRQLGKIKLPVRIVAGEFDLIRPAHTRSIAAAIPGAQVHFVPGEDHGSYIVGSTKFITEAQL